MTDFEAYLLAKMRATNLKALALVKEDLSPGDLQTKAREAALHWGLEKPGCSAANYAAAIGRSPVCEQVLLNTETVPVFASSIRRLYRLDLWPEVLFCVHEHPRGYAWGLRFVQNGTPGRFLDPTEVEPWEWVSDTIVAQASYVELIEHWGDQKDVRIFFSQDCSTQAYFGRFDRNLLQEWIREPSGYCRNPRQ